MTTQQKTPIKHKFNLIRVLILLNIFLVLPIALISILFFILGSNPAVFLEVAFLMLIQPFFVASRLVLVIDFIVLGIYLAQNLRQKR